MSYEKASEELMTPLVEYILDNHTIKFSSAGVFYLDNERITGKEFPPWFLKFCQTPETIKFAILITSCPSPTYLLESLKTHIKIGQSRHRASAFSGTPETVTGFSYNGMLPFISVENSKRILFFSKDTNVITNLDYETYAACTDKEYRLKPVPAVIHFNPYRPEQIYSEYYENQECTHLNTYRKPEWQLAKKLTDAEAKEYSKLPQIIDDFFHHLFPSESCREFVYDWLHYALDSRCETYMVLNGAKGIGKNVLTEIICKSLVGKDNHKTAHKGAMEQFNVILAECRMIVFDEFKLVDDESINTLKRFANEDQMIERKKIDVGKTEKTYNSYFVCNNGENDIKIVWDDRRFSIADLTEVKLDDVWSREKIDLLINICGNPESKEMRNFGYWLLYRKPTVMTSAFSVLKGRHFYRLCYTSLPEWSKMIVDEVTERPKPFYEEADLKMILKERTNGQSRLPNRTKIEDFLKNYKHNGDHYLGTIERDERTYYLQVSDHFMPKTKDSTGINFESTDWL